MEELIDEVDRKGKVIGTHPLSLLHRKMFLHKAVLVIPRAAGGKYLLSKRAKEKHPFPDSWCCGLGGKVSSGETEGEAVRREMREEIGRTYPVEKVVSFLYDRPDYKAIFTVFTTTVPVSPEELTLDPAETQYSAPFRLEDILRQIGSNPERFNPTFMAAVREFAKHIREKRVADPHKGD